MVSFMGWFDCNEREASEPRAKTERTASKRRVKARRFARSHICQEQADIGAPGFDGRRAKSEERPVLRASHICQMQAEPFATHLARLSARSGQVMGHPNPVALQQTAARFALSRVTKSRPGAPGLVLHTKTKSKETTRSLAATLLRVTEFSGLEGGGAEKVEGAGGVGVDVGEAAVVDDDGVEVPEVEGGQVAGGELLDADVVGDLLLEVGG
jgi:hypothetical protein